MNSFVSIFFIICQDFPSYIYTLIYSARYEYRSNKVGLISNRRHTSTDSNTSNCNGSLLSSTNPAAVTSAAGTSSISAGGGVTAIGGGGVPPSATGGGGTGGIGNSIRALTAATAAANAAAVAESTHSVIGSDGKGGIAVVGIGAEETVERLARMALQLSLDLQNGIDYYEHSFDK